MPNGNQVDVSCQRFHETHKIAVNAIHAAAWNGIGKKVECRPFCQIQDAIIYTPHFFSIFTRWVISIKEAQQTEGQV